MLNLGALDVVISLVVVLIILSLVVQSIQQLIKKVLKLKSRTIESSLADLLDKVVTPIPAGQAPAPAQAATGAAASPAADAATRGAFRRMFGKAKEGEELVVKVVDELKSLGRRSLFNRPILDSIAKDDVVKVLTKVGAAQLYPAYRQRFQEVENALRAVVQALDAAQAITLTGSASAKLAALEQALGPLIYDLASLSDGQGVKATAVVGDLIGIRHVQMQSVFAILGEVQDQIKQDIAAAQGSGQQASQPTAGLEAGAAALRAAAAALKDLAQKVEDAVAPLAAKLNEVDLWYDTVMQGFDERYTRHMKTVAVGIAVVTVLALNANFFSIYQALAHNPAAQAAAAATGQQILGARASQAAPAAGSPPAATGTDSLPAATGTEIPPATAAKGSPPVAAATDSPQAASGTTPAEVRQAVAAVQSEAQTYQAFGFRRLHREDIEKYWSVDAPWGNTVRAKDGSVHWGDAGPWLGEGLSVLFGWLITILLLSAGAPFWEDILESLFGLKSLVRQKTSTQNVEEGGGGQPKP